MTPSTAYSMDPETHKVYRGEEHVGTLDPATGEVAYPESVGARFSPGIAKFLKSQANPAEVAASSETTTESISEEPVVVKVAEPEPLPDPTLGKKDPKLIKWRIDNWTLEQLKEEYLGRKTPLGVLQPDGEWRPVTRRKKTGGGRPIGSM